MTAPRQAMFQRKGNVSMPPTSGPIPTDAPDTSADSQDASPLDVAVCPNCDCAFNPASGEILSVGGETPSEDATDASADTSASVDPSTMPMPEGMFS